MYKKILVALDNSPADQCLLSHIASLAEALHSSLTLVHVAEGWAARYYEDLLLKESQEMVDDRKYLETKARELIDRGIEVNSFLAQGEPAKELLKIAAKEQCDLIAMASHGHGFLGDLFLGSVIEEVRHHTSLPLLVINKS